MSATGPWDKVLEEELADSRNQPDPLPLQIFKLEKSVEEQFIKFDLLEWYGLGGGLQYLDIDRPSDLSK